MFKVGWLRFRRDVKGLVAALAHPDIAVRRAACWALHDIRSHRSVEPLVALLEGGDPLARRMAAWVLWVLAGEGVRGIDEAAGPLHVALTDQDPGVRENACRALTDLAANGSVRATELLIAALSNEHYDVRTNAARLLGHLKDAAVVEPLLGALEDPEAEVRKRAALSLGRRADQRAVEPLTAALEDEDESVRHSARMALSELRARLSPDPDGS